MNQQSFYYKFFIAVGVSGFVMCAGLIITLLFFYGNAKENLNDAAKNLRAIGDTSIDCIVPFDAVIEVDTFISIEGSSPIKINMHIDDSMPLAMPFNLDTFFLVNIDLDTVLHVDTSLILPDTLHLMVTGEIPVDQKFTAYKKFKVPIKAVIPLREMLNAKLNGATKFISDIPIRLNINKVLPLKLPAIRVNQNIRINLPIHETASVSFPQKLKIKTSIPIHLNIPVKIQLRDTPLKEYLDRTAKDLNNVFTF